MTFKANGNLLDIEAEHGNDIKATELAAFRTSLTNIEGKTSTANADLCAWKASNTKRHPKRGGLTTLELLDLTGPCDLQWDEEEGAPEKADGANHLGPRDDRYYHYWSLSVFQRLRYYHYCYFQKTDSRPIVNISKLVK